LTKYGLGSIAISADHCHQVSTQHKKSIAPVSGAEFAGAGVKMGGIPLKRRLSLLMAADFSSEN